MEIKGLQGGVYARLTFGIEASAVGQSHRWPRIFFGLMGGLNPAPPAGVF